MSILTPPIKTPNPMSKTSKDQQQMTIEVRSDLSDLRVETREGAEGGAQSRTIIGYAAKFDKWSEPIMGWFRERIARDAFNDTDMSDAIMFFNTKLIYKRL